MLICDLCKINHVRINKEINKETFKTLSCSEKERLPHKNSNAATADKAEISKLIESVPTEMVPYWRQSRENPNDGHSISTGNQDNQSLQEKLHLNTWFPKISSHQNSSLPTNGFVQHNTEKGGYMNMWNHDRKGGPLLQNNCIKTHWPRWHLWTQGDPKPQRLDQRVCSPSAVLSFLIVATKDHISVAK